MVLTFGKGSITRGNFLRFKFSRPYNWLEQNLRQQFFSGQIIVLGHRLGHAD